MWADEGVEGDGGGGAGGGDGEGEVGEGCGEADYEGEREDGGRRWRVGRHCWVFGGRRMGDHMGTAIPMLVGGSAHAPRTAPARSQGD